MDRFIIQGGRQLSGEYCINGAKNAILAIMAASLLSDEQVVLTGVPMLEDVHVMSEVLSHYGAKVLCEDSTFIISADNLHRRKPPEQLLRKMRASNLVLGPLLARLGEIELTFPGGCAIGERPMDYHIQALTALGADVDDSGNTIRARIGMLGLHGQDIYFDFPSVGATENAIMTAVTAKGETIIHNAAREPEVIDLIIFLRKMGAEIYGEGTDTLKINGVERLHGAEHKVMRDRIEAGTLMCATAICGGDLLLKDCRADDMYAVIAKLEEAGVIIDKDADGVRIRSRFRPRSVDIRTMPFPGFPTDMQPQFMALMSVSSGVSIISENIFENRFHHVGELRRMGADIRIIGKAAVIKGRWKLHGAHVEASDLRAGAALVIASLAAEGESIIENIRHIDRGYQNFDLVLVSIGAEIKREYI